MHKRSGCRLATLGRSRRVALESGVLVPRDHPSSHTLKPMFALLPKGAGARWGPHMLPRQRVLVKALLCPCLQTLQVLHSC